MSPKTIVITVLVGVLLICGVGFGVWYVRSSEAEKGAEQAQEEARPTSTRLAVPDKVVVPDAGASTIEIPKNVVVPSVVNNAAPNVETKYRLFNLTLKGGQILPENTLAVRAGDTVHINFTAEDKNYDIVQPDNGFSLQLPKGSQKFLEFSVQEEGKYVFYCKSCGGPEQGPVGYIIVVR